MSDTTMSYLTCLVLLPLSILLITANSTLVIEWEIYQILSTTIKLDLILEWKRTWWLQSKINIRITAAGNKTFSYRRDNLNFWRLTTPTVTAILFSTKLEQLLTVIDNVCQEFRWQPVANESMLDVYRAWLSMKVDERPQLIITSSAAVSQS